MRMKRDSKSKGNIITEVELKTFIYEVGTRE